MVVFYKRWKKYSEIQLTKNKMDFNNRKIKNHVPSTAHAGLKWTIFFSPVAGLNAD